MQRGLLIRLRTLPHKYFVSQSIGGPTMDHPHGRGGFAEPLADLFPSVATGPIKADLKLDIGKV